MKNKKKTLIMCAAALLCLIIIILLGIYWFNSGKNTAQGKFFTAETKRAGAKKIAVTISGEMPAGCSWTVSTDDPFEISSEKQSDESFSFKISAKDDGFSDINASCRTEDGSEYSRLVILASSDKKRVSIEDMSFMFEPAIFTQVEGLESTDVKISDDKTAPDLIIGKKGNDWSFVYDPAMLAVTESNGVIYEYVETGEKNEIPMLVVSEEESDTQSVKITPAAAGNTVFTLVNRGLALKADLEFEITENEGGYYTMALVSAGEGTYEFDGAAEKAAEKGASVSGYKLPEGAVVKSSVGITVEKDEEGIGIENGKDGVLVEFLYDESVMDLYMTDKFTKDELAEAAIGDLSALKAETLGSAMLYTDKSEDGRAGCAAVWSEGKTSYVLLAPCSAETMKSAIDSMK